MRLSIIKKIGVFPPEEMTKRSKLFKALELAFPVYFSGVKQEEFITKNAVIIFSKYSDNFKLMKIPSLIFIDSGSSRHSRNGGQVDFGREYPLDSRLRGQSIFDSRCSGLKPITAKPEDTILASYMGQPIWLARKFKSFWSEISSLPPEEIVDHTSSAKLPTNDRFFDFYGTFRYQLNEDRFFSFLPLIHFLREVTAEISWTPPKLRAAFIIDDPNLRFLSYGFLKFPDIISHAKNYNYHAVISAIPLDLFWESKKTVNFIRENKQYISLAIHGNNHLFKELLHCQGNELALMAQALRRVDAFEKKYNMPISRVVIAPHDRYSQEICREMAHLGIEALCSSRTFAWRGVIDSLTPVIGLYPADLIAGGFPVITRRDYKTDFVLRAFLNQPIISTLHNIDFASGLDFLKEISSKINKLAEVEWTSLSSIAQSNFMTKKENNLLKIKLVSRRIKVEIPEGIDQLVVEIPPVQGNLIKDSVCINNSLYILHEFSSGRRTEPISITSGMKNIEISLYHPDFINYYDVPQSKFKFWPYIRRFLTEGRDRLYPIFK